MRQRQVKSTVKFISQFIAVCIFLLAALAGQGVAQRGSHSSRMLAVGASGPALTTLVSFDGSDGAEPFASLIQGADGNFYGTTEYGGAIDDGTVFEITPTGVLTTLYNFCSQLNCADGEFPYAGLVQGSDGNFYGTTIAGGANEDGTVFKITPAGVLTTLYNFCSLENCTDGAVPYAGLAQGSDGNFYGTTIEGGFTEYCEDCGTIFKITPAGVLTTLYSFCSQNGCTDGEEPYAGLVQGGDGSFYGTTEVGGANDYGTVFKMTVGGSLTTLYSFCSQTDCADGAFPVAGLVQGSDGNFYGTTVEGGANEEDAGTVFRITPAGALTTLYSFCAQEDCTDGAYPYAGLVQGSDGNFYGTTSEGGTNFFGGVFEITPAGLLTTLYSFCSQGDCTDGAYPFAGLVQGSDGNFYGTTFVGGAYYNGTVFSLTPGGLALACPSQAAEVGVSYSSALVASGGVAPYTFSIVSGSLPGGLTLNSSTGAITGTPTTTGTFSFTAQVVDSQSNSATANCSIVVYATGSDPTNTTLTLVPNTLVVGSSGPVLMTATVAPVSGGGTPTGTVTYFNNTGQIGTGTLSSGVATLNYNPSGLAQGTYPIVGVYSGDSVFAPSASPAVTLTITSGQGFTTLVDFQGSTNGDSPYYGSLIQGIDGNVYGTTYVGGLYDQGTVFKVASNGTLTTIYTFCSQLNCEDGAEPSDGLVQAANGNFYGTTQNGGANGFAGTIFEITPTGNLTTLYSFCSQPGCTDGQVPFAGLVPATNGNFYGTTLDGGANGEGTVFEITPTGQLTTLYSFCSQQNCADGERAYAGLVQATNGNLYGTTFDGGANGAGTVFEITPAGQFTTLYSFCAQAGCTDGANPYAALVQATNGSLYGTTFNGGANGAGTVFGITSPGQFGVLYNFCSQQNCADGSNPSGALLQASDGNLYGTTVNGGVLEAVFSFGTVFGMTTAGQLTTLHTFGFSDGAYPYGGLVEGPNGDLYGTTSSGGTQYDGTVFTLPVGLDVPKKKQAESRITGAKIVGAKIAGWPDLPSAANARIGGKTEASFLFRGTYPEPVASIRRGDNLRELRDLPWIKLRNRENANALAGPTKVSASKGKAESARQALTTLLNFDGANGAFPLYASLTQGTDGNLYGTTFGGGIFDDGNVFKVTPGGTLTTLYTFCSQTNCTDGALPYAGLVQASNGNFYGTTVDGGFGPGTVFEITSTGQLTTLYNFCSQANCADGALPEAALVQATNGNLYGTTFEGGANGLGTVFQITPAGQLSTIYSFCSLANCSDGALPEAALVQAANGNLYGTTSNLGSNGEGGTVFEITTTGQLTTLYSFCSQANCADGAFPEAGLVQASNGNFYGTTFGGGVTDFCVGCGTVFELTPANQLTTLYSFCSQSDCADGAEPSAALIQAGGNFYGTAPYAGPNGYGTVFEMTPAGQLSTLYGFDLTDGAFPEGGLALGNGNLYGMTDFGGNRFDGVVYSLPLSQQSLTLACPTYTAQVGVAYNSALNASGGVAPYTFSIPSGSLPPGLTLNTSTGAITGTPTTAGTYDFTAQVVDSQENTVTTNCGIVVSPSALTLSCPNGTGQVGLVYNSALMASGGVGPYTFSITSGSLPPGLTLNSSTGAITGIPTTAGTYSFTAQVVDSQGNKATASCSIIINPAQSCTGTNNGSLNGNYAFLFQGWSNFSGTGYALTGTAGSLVFDGNGNITSGQYDQNDPVDGPSQGTLTGTYCVPGNNLGTMTVKSSAGVTTTYAFVLQSNGSGSIIPFDTTTPYDASGIFLKQNTNDFSTSDFVGQYSLGFIGVDNANSRFALAGAVTANGTANLTNGELDADDGGNYFNGTFNSNNFNVTSSGRGTVSLNVSGVGTGDFAFYVVNSSQLLILQIDPISQGLQTLFSGQVVQQQGLTYSDSDLNGVSVLGFQALDTNCEPACPDAQLVLITWNGAGSASYTGDENDGGTVSSSSGTGTYVVGSNGRVPISGTGEHSPIFYLTGKNAGFLVSAGGSKVQFGSMVAQSGSNFNNSSLSGNYYGGTSELVSSNTCGEVFLVNASSGSGSGTQDKNCGESPQSSTNAFTYTVSPDGRTVITSNTGSLGILDIVSPANDGSGGGFIYLPWEGNPDPTLQTFVSSATLTLSCPTGTAQVGVAYSSALTATGGAAPYTFSIVSGSLPPGLTLNPSTGAITGTPTTSGTYSFTAQVTDSQGNTATSNCGILVSSSTLTLSCPSGTAEVGVAYNSALTVSGGVAPYTFSISIGALPPGLALNSSTGAITGTPTMAGTYSFTGQVVDSQGNTASTNCSIVVSSPALTLSCPAGTAQVGVAYSSALNAAGGAPPYTFSIVSGALPPGLTLNPSTGAITGTPTTTGTYSFTAQVVDSQENTATASCSIVVTTAGTSPTNTSLTLSPASVPLGSVGPIVMTATVTPVSGGTPTGSVTYFNGSTQIGTATLSGGVGTFDYNPSNLAVGIYSITAVYSGDGTFSASTSPAQTLAITQTGPFAYVANNGSDTVSVVNIPTAQVANSILVGSGPWGTAISPDQTQIYVTNNQGNSVSVINAASGSVVATIPVQSSPMGVVFSPDQSWVYVVNESSNTVSVINPATQTVVYTVQVQNNPVSVAMAPTSNGTFAYVTNSGSNTVSVIAVGNNPTVVQTIPVGTGPQWVTVSPNSAWAYVENTGSNNVSVISVATNQVTTTISVGTSPTGAAFTPDNSTVYVANSGSNNVSVIDTKSTTVIDTVAGFNDPVQVALTTDGSSAYVTNQSANTVSTIATATNTISGTVGVGSAPIGVAIASAPQQTLQITQPLNPTQQNNFNFGSNTYAVQYPPGTQFSNVNMTVTAVEITQAQFQQRVAGTQFANASCIVYGGGAGNCIDDQVTCSDMNGNPISCPSEPTATIAVQTSLTTGQAIINPGYLTTPIGQNQWQNIFTGFSDPTVKGKTQGFSEFIAVALGATGEQGAAHFELLRPRFPRQYVHGERIPIVFRLTSVANGKPINHAIAGLSVVMIADAKGNPTQTVVYAKTRAFKEFKPGKYIHDLAAHKYAAGTYSVTIYGDSFPAYTGQFKILH